MVHVLLLMGTGLFAVLLQTTVFHLLPLGGFVPDLVVVLTVYLAVRLPTLLGAFGAFLLGYLFDAFAGRTIGLNAFAMSLIFLLVRSVSRWVWTQDAFSTGLFVFLASCVKTGSVLILMTLFEAGEIWGIVTLKIFLEESLVAALLAPWIFRLLDWSETLFRSR